MKKREVVTIKMDSVSENEEFARVAVAVFLSRMDPTLEEIEDVKTAVSEAVTNAVIHGYQGGEGTITLEVSVEEDVLTVLVQDEGVRHGLFIYGGLYGSGGGGVRPRLRHHSDHEKENRQVTQMTDTMEYIRRAHQGDKEARDALVTENMGLIWSIVRRFAGRGYDLEDLFQIGSIGLMKAIDKFDLSMDVKLSTYAVPMITGEIRRFLRDDGMIKVSRPLKELAAKTGAARERLEFSLGREPTIEELAREVGASREEVAASLEAGAEVESIYRPVGRDDENGGCLMDRIAEKNSENDRVLNRMVLTALLKDLGEQEQQIILKRYFENKTQTVIASELGISQVQVSRLEKKILRQLRERMLE